MPNAPKVRVRFAPSPTGDVHIGSIWLAQFDWLFARQHQGAFIVRIEDTDQKRFVPGAVEKIYQALDWYGLTPDEGPEHGGAYGPYVQSQRLDLYRQHAEALVANGQAYYCFCTPERLEEMRQRQQALKQPPKYDKQCRNIPIDTARARVAAGERAVIRLDVPTTGTVAIDDLIRGRVEFSYSQVDDAILLKSDGYPTYHLAVVVDDHAMEITHVIRGEEWLPSTPKHVLLYKCFGWSAPQFAHLPQILGPNKKKLSKRDGAASALEFRDRGYLPEAMQNFLALMGWHPKGDAEQLSRRDVLEQFRLEEMNPSGAIFDQAKLDWLNGVYIRALPIDELRHRLEPFWHLSETPGEWTTGTRLDQLLTFVRDRLVRLSDIDGVTQNLFPNGWDTHRTEFDRALLIPRKGSLDAALAGLQFARSWVHEYVGAWEATSLKTSAIAHISAQQQTNAGVLWPLRVALSLQAASPDVFDILGWLGRDESLRRIDALLAG